MRQRTLIIDNYDSFTYNLYQIFAELKAGPAVFANNKITLKDIQKFKPTHIVISPGPGSAANHQDFGVCSEVILKYGATTPLLGVCLGHQGIALAFGAKIEHSPQIMHGKTSRITHNNRGIFKNIENPFTAMRYHSLAISTKNVPKDLIITAQTPNPNTNNPDPQQTIMAIQHSQFPIFGIQFHPESFATPEGEKILKNFLNF